MSGQKGKCKVSVKAVDKLNRAELRLCRSLTLRADGMMRGQLAKELSAYQEGVEEAGKAQAVLVHNTTGQLLGWGVLVPLGWDGPEVQLYVRRCSRRQGVGTRIMEEAFKSCARKSLKKPSVDSNTQNAHFFYNKFGKKVA
jgi:GNAT superfamily N-acetyltransferase